MTSQSRASALAGHRLEPAPWPNAGPFVVCVRGPSRSGKTTVAAGLVRELGRGGFEVAYLKRTHHLLDLPNKSSARIWESAPAVMVLSATDRLQVTLPPGTRTVVELLEHLPVDVDVVLLETHEPEPYPTILVAGANPFPGESVVARWSTAELEDAVASVLPAVRERLPRDPSVARAMRQVGALHGGHACPGLVLGARLALAGGEAMGCVLPDREKRLFAAVETDRCAIDAIQSITGCRPGKRTMRFLDYGKLAATFYDARSGRAVRIATRSGLRGLAAERYPESDSRHAQILAYMEMPAAELFDQRCSNWRPGPNELPGRPIRRVECTVCGEEVSDGRDVKGVNGPLCRPCASHS